MKIHMNNLKKSVMYAKLENGVFIPAPNHIGNIFNPNAETLLEQGYKPVIFPDMSEVTSGKEVYEERETEIIVRYEAVV